MRGLYLVTPNWDDTARLLSSTRAALDGGAALVQYRHKDADEALRREQAEALLVLCRRHGVPLIINDHIDLCLALDADGVHACGLRLAEHFFRPIPSGQFNQRFPGRTVTRRET